MNQNKEYFHFTGEPPVIDKKIIDYVMVCGPVEVFSHRVKVKLNFGYIPFGSPFSHNGEFNQAMIKYAAS